MKQAFFFLLLISVFSCKKENELKDYRKTLNGDWEWVSSTSGKNGGTSSPLITYSPAATNTNYGLRIKRNNNAFLYKNGKLIKKGELEHIENASGYVTSIWGDVSNDYYYKITFVFDGEPMIFDNRTAPLECTTWPYTNYSNTFKKN